MKKFIITTFLLLTSFLIFAQEDNEPYLLFKSIDISGIDDQDWKSEITFEPAYTFVHGLKFNFDIPLSQTGQYLILQPIFYYNDKGNYYYSSSEYDKMRGIGIGLGHRIYLHKTRYLNSVYVQYNALMTHFTTHHNELHNVSYVEDGVEYIRYEEGKFTKPFTKTGFDFVMGKQLFIDNVFVMDAYFGLGFRYTIDKKFNQFEEFNEAWTSLGYSGIILNAGIRIGFTL